MIETVNSISFDEISPATLRLLDYLLCEILSCRRLIRWHLNRLKLNPDADLSMSVFLVYLVQLLSYT